MDRVSTTGILHATSLELYSKTDTTTRKPPSSTLKARLRSISANIEKDIAAMKLYRDNLERIRAPQNCMQTPSAFPDACGQIQNVFGNQLQTLKEKLAEEVSVMDSDRIKIHENIESLRLDMSSIQSQLKSISGKLGTFELCIGHD